MKLFFSLLIAACLFGCSNKKAANKESVTGVWKPVELNMKEVDEKEKAEILSKATIEFTNDGKYISKFGEEMEQGTYTYNEKDQRLITRSDKEREEKFSVSWEDEIIVLTKGDGESLKMKKAGD